MPIRFDQGKLRKPFRNASGFLRSDAYVTRVGVFNYLNSDGTIRRELRHPDEVFSADSLATLALLPVTMEHPGTIVTDENARDFAIGTTGERAQREDRYIQATIQINDRKAISKIEANSKRDLSCGYLCDKEMTPGITKGIEGVEDGLRYDLVQRNIRYNHVALTERGRAGPEVSIPRLDSAVVDDDVAVMVNDSQPTNITNKPGAIPMETITIDGVEYEVSKQAAQAYRKQAKNNDALVADLRKKKDSEAARADAAEESLKTEKKKVEDSTAAAAAATSPEKVAELVAARVKLVTDAKEILAACDALNDKDGNEIDLTVMDDATIRKTAVLAMSPDFNIDGKSDDYLTVRFEYDLEKASEKAKANQDAKDSRDAVQAGANNTKPADNNDTFVKRQQAAQDSWMEPLPVGMNAKDA
jgi:hypothetical protein